MSTTIDERVVSMQFDNKKFESNVATSMSTLEKLKQSLNLTGAAKGLENVESAARKCNLSPLSSAVENVGLKFNAMYSIADQAFRNITNSAMAAGKRLISAFTIDPVKTGLAEYETQIGAVQTILANTQSKGTTLDDVMSALDTLNTYADKTIYNFTEMTRNIGTFTAAGVDLDTSVNAIQGIANLAAISGSTSQQASTAMYQLSQALSSGTVKLQDWNSVVNAGMGGQVFQDALMETARVHGIAIDQMIDEHGSFRETLQEGWLTSEILTETLMKFTMATEGLTDAQIEQNKAMLKAMGYSDEQIEGIFKLGNTATDAATKVKTFTQLMDTLKESAQSGWTQTWEIIIGDFEQAKELWTNVSDVLGGIITASAEARNKVLRGAFSESTWGEFTTKLEEAGVTMEDFEASVRQTAEEHGHDVDALIAKYGSLENAIKAGAIGTDILKASLDNLGRTGESVDLSGVTRSLGVGSSGEDVKKVESALKLLGYNLYGKDGKDYGYAEDGYFGTLTEEAIKDFQRLNGLKVTGIVDEATLAALEEACNKTEKLSDSVYALIDGFGNLGGRQKLIDGVSNAFTGLKNVVAPIKDAFREIFPPTTAEELYNLVNGFAQLTEKFKIWTESAEGQEVIGDIASAFKGFFSIIDIGWTFVKDLAGGIFDLLGSVLSLGGGIVGAAGSLGEWISGLRDSVKEGDYFGKTIDAIVGFLKNVIDKIKSVTSFLGEKLVAPGWEGFVSILKGIWGFIQKIGSKIAEVGSAIGSVLGDAFRNGDIEAGLDILNGGLLAAALLSVKKFFGGLGDTLSDGAGLLDNIKEVLGSVGDALEAWQQDLKSGILLKIAAAIGILAASVLVLASIDPARLAASLGAITVLFADLVGSLKLFSTFSGDMKGVAKASIAMVAMSTAVLILASALKKIADLSWEDLAKGLVGVAGLTAMMVVAAKALSSNSKKTMKGATQMIIFAAAIKVLASACKDLSSLSWEELAKGLVGVGVLLAEVSIFMRTAKFSGKSITTATGIVIMSAAIKILASACKDFGQMSWEEIGKGLAAIGALLLELSLFTKLTGNAKKVISTGIALVAIGAAMKIFASAIKDFSGMSWEELGRGLAGMAGALVAVTIAMKLMPKNMIGIGVGFIAVSAGLLILSNALTEMSSMSWIEIARGLVAMGGSIAILAIGLNLMNGTLAGSAAMLIAAAALAILTPVLKALGSMSWESIAKGLVAIAGAFVIIGVAGLVLTPIVPTILALGGAFALIGVGVLALGAGLTALATGITALAVAGSAAGSAIASFCRGITDSIVEIGNMLKALVLTIVDVLVESIPAIADGAVQLIVGVLNALVEYTPQIVDGIMQFLISALDAVAARTPELVKSVLNVVTSLFTAVADAIMGLDGSTLAKAAIGVALMGALMALFSVLAPLIPGAIVGVLGMGLVIAELALVLAAIGALSKIPGLTWLVGEGATLMANIGNAIGGFVGGIVGGVAQGLSSSLVQIGTDLSTFMTNIQPFLDGAKNIDQSTVDAVGNLVGVIAAITGASLLEGIASFITGTSSIESFGTQLVSLATALTDFSDNIQTLSEDDVTKIGTVANVVDALVEVSNKVPATGGLAQAITGVPDLSLFATGLIDLGGSVTSFSSSVSDITESDISKITSLTPVIDGLVGVANKVPKVGGLAQAILGTPCLTTFANGLVSLGGAISSFSTSVSDITEGDATKISSLTPVIESLIEVSKKVPEVGGLAQAILGTPDLSTFASGLISLGVAISSFSSSVSTITLADAFRISALVPIVSSLISVANQIPETGGLKQAILGAPDLGAFAGELKTFGEKVAEFASATSEVTQDDITRMSNIGTAASTLVSIATDLSGYNGSTWFNTNLTEFAGELKAFGDKMAEYSNSVKDVDTGKIGSVLIRAKSMLTFATTVNGASTDSLVDFGGDLDSFGGKIKSFYNKIKGIDTTKLSSITTSLTGLSSISATDSSGLSSFVDSLGNVGTGGVDAFVKAFDGAASKIQSVGRKTLTNFMNGAKTEAAKMSGAFKSLASNMANGMKGSYATFREVGRYLVKGFANGIALYTYIAKNAAKKMAAEAAKGAKEELQIRSPSRVGKEIGRFFGMGFVDEIAAYSGKAYDASVSMASYAREGLTRAISKVQSLLDSGLETQPTIRPVLDLSDIEAGAGAINGMFRMQPSVGVLSDIGTISYMMNKNQNGVTNNDVVSAIKDLGQKIGNASGDTYNVNGVTYDDGSNITNAVKTLVRAAKVERRK